MQFLGAKEDSSLIGFNDEPSVDDSPDPNMKSARLSFDDCFPTAIGNLGGSVDPCDASN